MAISRLSHDPKNNSSLGSQASRACDLLTELQKQSIQLGSGWDFLSPGMNSAPFLISQGFFPKKCLLLRRFLMGNRVFQRVSIYVSKLYPTKILWRHRRRYQNLKLPTNTTMKSSHAWSSVGSWKIPTVKGHVCSWRSFMFFLLMFSFAFVCVLFFSEQDARKENNGLKTASENQKTSCCHKSVGQTESLFLD